MILLVAGLLGAEPATAQINTTFSGDTTGGATYNRPQANGTNAPTALSGTAVRYRAFSFTVSTTGSYVINTNTAGDAPAYDGYLGLYLGSFNPASPLTNALQYDDDTGGGLGSTNSQITRMLNAAQNYVLVQTGYNNAAFGVFTGSINGPGAAVILAAPEPASWGLMILGFGAAGAALRRRRRVGGRVSGDLAIAG